MRIENISILSSLWTPCILIFCYLIHNERKKRQLRRVPSIIQAIEVPPGRVYIAEAVVEPPQA